jgi:hypothetical protein
MMDTLFNIEYESNLSNCSGAGDVDIHPCIHRGSIPKTIFLYSGGLKSQDPFFSSS